MIYLFIFCIDGELFYIRHKGTDKQLKVKVVRGAAEADSIFKEFHASEAGGHSGKEKTINAISSRYYWPGMSVDIENWVSFTDILLHCINSASSYKKKYEINTE